MRRQGARGRKGRQCFGGWSDAASRSSPRSTASRSAVAASWRWPATSGSRARQARFGQPEVKLGIGPGYGGTVRLPRLVGTRARARAAAHRRHDRCRGGLPDRAGQPRRPGRPAASRSRSSCSGRSWRTVRWRSAPVSKRWIRVSTAAWTVALPARGRPTSVCSPQPTRCGKARGVSGEAEAAASRGLAWTVDLTARCFAGYHCGMRTHGSLAGPPRWFSSGAMSANA